jgi:hypothetical protein
LASPANVGIEPGPFEGEERAGAPDASLHLIGDDENASFAAKIADSSQVQRIERARAALSLGRLDDDGADSLAVNGRIEGLFEKSQIRLSHTLHVRQRNEFLHMGARRAPGH